MVATPLSPVTPLIGREAERAWIRAASAGRMFVCSR